MQIAFVTNQRKTVFYDALARSLEGRGVRCSFIALSRRWAAWLESAGWPRESILDLSPLGDAWRSGAAPSAGDLARLERIDATAQLGVRHQVMVDRELNRAPGAAALAYAAAVAGPVEDFVIARDIDIAVGEITWAPELLTAEIMRHHGRRFLYPTTIRLPSKRLALFRGALNDVVERVRPGPDADDRRIAREAIAALRDRGERPYYVARNLAPNRLRSHWLEEAMIALSSRGADRFDHTVPPLSTRIARRLRSRFNEARLKGAGFETSPPSGRDYVLVTLHKQPEASVDVCGYAAANQLENIRALARLLPIGVEIWVKEHAVALGDRDRGWYDSLLRIPGVRLLDPGLDPHALMRGARLVASVTGTSSLEAAALGVPSICFGPVFFSGALLASPLTPAAMTRAEFDALLDRAAALRGSDAFAQRVEDVVAALVGQSIEAYVSDPTSDPACIAASNIDPIADLYVMALTRGSVAIPRALSVVEEGTQ